MQPYDRYSKVFNLTGNNMTQTDINIVLYTLIEKNYLVEYDMKPEYYMLAEIMLQEIYHTPEEHRVDYIKEQLLKAVQRGYTDSLENGWWKEQEKSQ